jgi:hypothetical protein
MRHLSDSVVIEMIEGGGGPEARRHFEGCARCRGTVERFRTLLSALKAPAGETLPAGLAAWARAYARTAAPAELRVSVLDFLAGGSRPVPAVRGGLRSEAALLYGNESHQLDLRLEPAAEGRVRIHGQIVPLQGGGSSPWQVSLVTGCGELVTGTTDGMGEFWLDGVLLGPAGSLLVSNADDRVLVPRLESAEGRETEA